MRKPLASRIIGLAALYCVVFCVLVILQFSNKGSFTLSTGDMTIRGRYLHQTDNTGDLNNESENTQTAIPITGGVRVSYGGLEFNLKEERGKGLVLTGNDTIVPVNPAYMILTESTVRFILPGETIIVFNSLDSARGPELQVNVEFADNISEIIIPVAPRRSSLIRENGQIGIMYSGSRYFLNTPGNELEEGKMILSRNNSFVSYRLRSRQRAFDPSDYILAKTQNYDNIIRNWQDTNFSYWSRNAATLQNEDDIIAFLSEAFQRGIYSTSLNSIPGDFINSPRHSHRSSVFVGGMTNGYQSFVSTENDKNNLINRLIRERSPALLREYHVLDYLFTRGRTALANDVIEFVGSLEPQMLTEDHCAGLLEIFSDIRRWRPGTNNPIEHLTEQILLLISEKLIRDNENDTVFVSCSGGINFENNLRLGKALIYWGETTENTDWAGIGKSLVISAIENGNAGRLHNMLNPAEISPRAAWLTNEGHWVWTASQTVRASFIDGNMNIAFSFPANMSHYVMIRGIRPFNRIQIHGMDWRSDSQFERYDSSGWVYYPQEQILVLKIRHRATVENIRIIYRVDEPPPPPPPPAVTEDTSAETEINTNGENVD